MLEVVELVGTVLAVSSPAPGSARLTIDGVEDVTNHRGWFDLEVGGECIRVVARNSEFIGRPTRKIRQLRQEACGQIWIPTDLARKFQFLELALVEVAVGDHVALAGFVAERARVESGYRDRPHGAVTRVNATLVARGRSPHTAERQLSAARG